MKKYLTTIMILTMVIPTIVISNEGKIENNNIQSDEFTHTVFADYATTTWCPACPTASESLYSIYESRDYPFYYVSLVSDMNKMAKQRSNFYRTIVIPSVYFDGGEFYFTSTGSIESTISNYRSFIEESGSRDVEQIDISMTVSWEENVKITVEVKVNNFGNSIYLGILRSYITEIESRWNDNDGNPYHFALLDFAINRPILLFPQSSKSFSVTWDGTKEHDGQTYEDLIQNNTMIISTVSHWIPHINQGYQSPPKYDQKYLGFYIDQTTATIPE